MPSRVAVCLVILASACAAGCTSQSEPPTSAPGWVLDPSWPNAPAGFAFDEVSWVSVDRSSGLVWVLQRSAPPVSIWNPHGGLAGSWTTDALGDPHSLGIAGDGSIWITDMAPPLLAGTGYGHCIKRFDALGVEVGAIGACGENTAGTGLDPVQFDKVTDIAWSASGDAFVSDGDVDGLNNRVLELDANAAVLQDWSAPGNQPGSGPREFDLPHALEIDGCQRVWVADALNSRVQVIGTDGVYLGQWSCFDGKGVYGLDIGPVDPGTQTATVLLTIRTIDGTEPGEAVTLTASMDCAAPADFGACAPTATWPVSGGTFLHAAALGNDGTSAYFALLGDADPPVKYVLVDPVDGVHTR